MTNAADNKTVYERLQADERPDAADAPDATAFAMIRSDEESDFFVNLPGEEWFRAAVSYTGPPIELNIFALSDSVDNIRAGNFIMTSRETNQIIKTPGIRAAVIMLCDAYLHRPQTGGKSKRKAPPKKKVAWVSTGRKDGKSRTLYKSSSKPGELRIKKMAQRNGKTVATYVKANTTAR